MNKSNSTSQIRNSNSFESKAVLTSELTPQQIPLDLPLSESGVNISSNDKCERKKQTNVINQQPTTSSNLRTPPSQTSGLKHQHCSCNDGPFLCYVISEDGHQQYGRYHQEGDDNCCDADFDYCGDCGDCGNGEDCDCVIIPI